jgi:hypothetical protein
MAPAHAVIECATNAGMQKDFDTWNDKKKKMVRQ